MEIQKASAAQTDVPPKKIHYNYKKYFEDFLRIIFGATVTALTVQYVFDPAGLVTGGVSGLAIVIRQVTSQSGTGTIPLWLTNLVLNIPVFLFAWHTDGWKRIVRTGIAWVTMTAELYFFPVLPLPHDNLFLVAIYGGIGFGIGSGVLMTAKATTGGTDMLANSFSKIFRWISFGTLMQILDGMVVILGAMVFGIERTLYAIISVLIMGVVTDYIVDRGKKAKMVLIISQESYMISERILDEVNRGMTKLVGKGAYTGQDREVLICICSNKDVVDVKDIVKECDRKAFFVVGNVSEAMGEGFVDKWFLG